MVRENRSDISSQAQTGGAGNFVRNSAGNRLVEQNNEIDVNVKQALEIRKAEVAEHLLPSSDAYYFNGLTAMVSGLIRQAGYDPTDVVIAPPKLKNEATSGFDLAFNVAGLAKKSGKSFQEVSADLTAIVRTIPDVKLVEQTGPFVNIGLDFEKAAPRVLGQIDIMGNEFGHFRDGSPELVIVDFSSPNIAKNMTVAHLRSTIIGQSLIKIQAAAGNAPFGVNHIGDWGTQFGQYIYQYRKEIAERGDEFLAELEANPTDVLLNIYRKFNENKAKDPQSVEEARAIFLQLEQGDPELVELWDKFRKWSLRDFGPTYDRLGVSFDAIQGESFYEDRMIPTVEEALKQGVLTVVEEGDDKGAVVFPSQPLVESNGDINTKIMLDKEGDPRYELIIKPSGGTVYLTRDLAAIKYRAEELGADKILYVIGKEQQPHCTILFNMAGQMNYMPLGSAQHISFGHLTIDNRKMSSRSGKVTFLNDVLNSAIEEAAASMSRRKAERGESSELTDEEKETARKLGMAELIFGDLSHDRQNDIEFDPEAPRDIEAGKAIYIQYTSARLNAVLEKLGELPPLETVPQELDAEDRNLVMEISRFPDVVREAAEQSAPHKIAGYLTQLCRLVNGFYSNKSVVKAETAVERNFRAHVMKSANQVIANAATLLHFELPERI